MIDPTLRRGIESVEAELPYLLASTEAPYRYVEEPPPGVPREVGELDHQRTRIWSGWSEANQMSMDTYGFAMETQPTTFTQYWNEPAIRQHYYPEMEAKVLAHTGARRAVVFDHNVRFAPAMDGKHQTYGGKPARLVHNDYTPFSAPQRVHDLLSAEDAADVLRSRFAMVNLWRPIQEPLRDAPLALCDARSVAPDDLVVSALIYPDRRGEVFRMTFSPAHRWYYFPDMKIEELIFIKCYDSLEDGRARWSAHTAFDDPSCPADSPPRQSIEVRTLVWW